MSKQMVVWGAVAAVIALVLALIWSIGGYADFADYAHWVTIAAVVLLLVGLVQSARTRAGLGGVFHVAGWAYVIGYGLGLIDFYAGLGLDASIMMVASTIGMLGLGGLAVALALTYWR